ncbi:cilia- and flagella-associated protein 251-like isoform X7 [Oncorhynchus keta]|nr:cilia- and flagella-associated protein 251-like isoform X7 [Oncorhynchus keta]
MLATLKEEEKEEAAVFGMKEEEEGEMTVTVKEEEDVFGVKEEEEEEITVTLEDEEEKTGELINTRERPVCHSDSGKSPSEEPDPETPKPARRHPCSQ